jgi:formamidopyrimidine-DNA glycosylase
LPCAITPCRLLLGECVTDLIRHGKQLALLSDNGRAISVQLGMTGRLWMPKTPDDASAQERHVHIMWTLESGRMLFCDARRFGSVEAFPNRDVLQSVKWNVLGPDALTITGPELHRSLGITHRAIKAALLDQSVLAGVGNIYADEALFRARISPHVPASYLDADACARVATCIREVLELGIMRGGSTIRDYRDGRGEAGSMQDEFLVYGRGGMPCNVCEQQLTSGTVAQRTTVWCETCQKNRLSR